MKHYYILDYLPDIKFNTYTDCIDYDIKHNPELHSTKEQSFQRCEDVVMCITVD